MVEMRSVESGEGDSKTHTKCQNKKHKIIIIIIIKQKKKNQTKKNTKIIKKKQTKNRTAYNAKLVEVTGIVDFWKRRNVTDELVRAAGPGHWNEP